MRRRCSTIIGRRMQYDQGIPHEKASAGIAKEILPECGFSGEETGMILEAILSHRKKETGVNLNALMYRADKMSRLCFCLSFPVAVRLAGGKEKYDNTVLTWRNYENRKQRI